MYSLVSMFASLKFYCIFSTSYAPRAVSYITKNFLNYFWFWFTKIFCVRKTIRMYCIVLTEVQSQPYWISANGIEICCKNSFFFFPIFLKRTCEKNQKPNQRQNGSFSLCFNS